MAGVAARTAVTSGYAAALPKGVVAPQATPTQGDATAPDRAPQPHPGTFPDIPGVEITVKISVCQK